MRKDSWTNEDDLLLANTVLDFTRSGKSQLQAFEEAERLIGRTSAACGFRWNSEVRKGYEGELRQAKIEGKQNRKPKDKSNDKMMAAGTVEIPAAPSEIVSGTDILETMIAVVNEVVATMKAMQKDNEKLQRENAKLKKMLEDKPNPDDLNALMQLIEKAKQIGVLTDKNPAV